MNNTSKNMASRFCLFLIGLGSVTQFHFVGSIGISEMVIFIVAPVLFCLNYSKLRADGFSTFVWLSIMSCIGCYVSGLVNNTYKIDLLKGIAAPYSIFSATVVLHHFLRKDMDGLRWIIIGIFISSIVSIFVFQPETYTVRGGHVVSGDEAVAAVTGYALFWSSRVSEMIRIPIKCFYLQVPSLYIYTAIMLTSVISLFFSKGSGRAVAAAGILAGCILIAGRKKRRYMASIGKHLGIFVCTLLVAIVAVRFIYSNLAKGGYLGDAAKVKYIKQTQLGSSLLRMLMSGRTEFFAGIRACFDRPIIGWGPSALDHKRYGLEYLEKYGSNEDFDNYLRSLTSWEKRGYTPRIPAHSHIEAFWLYDGIFGLMLWLYVLVLFVMYFKRYAQAIPQWFGYFALSIPSAAWDIFFSPFGSRMPIILLIVCILFARSVWSGKLRLPMSMEMEIVKYEV